ncbi:MAG: pectinesterase family protein, partial [Eubacteriales bacterium]|nr:pectinesterase family protein [Eubacteriales bacterium]
MSKNRRIKKAMVVATTTAMIASMAPVAAFTGIFNPVQIVMAEETEQSTVKTTIWNSAEIGEHETKGTASFENGALTITGAGTKFDKDTGIDDLSHSYFDVKGDVTITAKMTATGSGFAGIMLRNSVDADSQTEALYADFGKNQIRYGRHGGKNGANGLGSAKATDTVYLKIEIVDQVVKYTVATQADFSDGTVKKETLSGIDTKTVGFFATDGATATFSDINVTSTYTTDSAESVSKVVFDSTKGELTPSYSTSASYSGSYDAGNSLTTTADGNTLKVTQTRSAAVKGNIREDKGVDYLLFPATSEDMTIKADVTINTVDSGTDKQGIAMGQFVANEGSATAVDVLHFQKNKVFQHTYSAALGKGGCGDPKTSTVELGKTYSLTYTKSGNKADYKVVAADGTVLLDSASAGTTVDLSAETYYAGLQSGNTVQYGFAFTGISVDLSNVQLLNAAGQVVYDMNDYYIAVGVAPTISNAVAKVADDRNSIDLTWDVTEEGSGNVKYAVFVSKDGGEFTKVSDSKVNSFSFAAMSGDGSYAFKIIPYGGETAGTEILTSEVSYQTPLSQTKLSADGSSTEVSLSWEAVEGATSYDVYKALGSNGTMGVVVNTASTSYVDKDVKAEEPYYYYIVAKNDNNTSNPSKTMQVLTSDGHTGDYVYENAATKVTVVSKSNDTVFTDNASVTLKADEAVSAKLVVNGNAVATKSVSKDEEFTFDMSLTQGRNDVEVLLTDAEGNTTRKVFNFVSNPKYDIVVDSSYAGEDGAVVNGYATYKTVEAAVNSVPADNAESKVIFIKNGEYNERVTVESPNVSLLGEDAEKTHLFYSVCIANGNASSMWNRNAMYVDSTADGFTAENLTVENSYNYTNGSDQQADALCIVADKTSCVNVRLIGYQDTLLTDSRVKGTDGNYEVTRQYFDKCYITGNVDFIYGAGTSVFTDCDIVARYTSYKTDGCYTAGRTYGYVPYGYVFDNCRFLAEDGVADGAYRMARPWGADDSTTFINCYLGRAINVTEGSSYGDMSGNLAANARFAEYGSYGPGYAENNTRPLLTSSQAATYNMNTIFGDFDVEKTVESLYKSETKPSDGETTKPSES